VIEETVTTRLAGQSLNPNPADDCSDAVRRPLSWLGDRICSRSPSGRVRPKIDARATSWTAPHGFGRVLDTQIALVEAEEGVAVIPSFGIPACRNRKAPTS